MPDSKRSSAQGLAKEVLQKSLAEATSSKDPETIALNNLKAVVAEEVRAVFSGAQEKQVVAQTQAPKTVQTRTWAAVANGVPASAQSVDSESV